ncbi:MAG TPA: hypothetical protein VFO07_11735 [Roseiflexaceae bacterium]|nr:hypothetical protein [Roseiflexaceae bacterium]
MLNHAYLDRHDDAGVISTGVVVSGGCRVTIPPCMQSGGALVLGQAYIV